MAQAVRQNTARRPRPDDNIIKFHDTRPDCSAKPAFGLCWRSQAHSAIKNHGALKHWLCRNLRWIFTGTSHPFPVFLFKNTNTLIAQILFHIYFIAQ
jgi:hypothetical protein